MIPDDQSEDQATFEDQQDASNDRLDLLSAVAQLNHGIDDFADYVSAQEPFA